MSEEQIKPLPAAPIGVTDPEQISAAEERWENCPLRDCKRNNTLLYEDFYLRDIRTNRIMCSACAVRAEMGYMAREVIKASDDRFFQGTQLDNLIVFGVMLVAGAIGAAISFMVWFYFAFIIGGAIGGVATTLARKLSGRRVTRQIQYFGVAGVIAGSVLAIFGYSIMSQIPFEYLFTSSILSVGASAAGILAAAWGVLLRRI
jgi:hypothetical protein